MANLFGKNKLLEIAGRIDTEDILQCIAIIKTWHHDYHHGTLKADKETSREQAYNQDVFMQILGYKEKPASPYSFEPKATTEKSQYPDAVLSCTDKSKNVNNISAVVELKGAAIDLDRPQRREGNMSPVQQGFKYKIQYRNCPFVVVSNFWEFRLYHDNQLDYEKWTLDDLIDPANDYLKFKTFYTLIHSDNLTTPKGSSKTEDLLSDIRLEQEEIGKKFYRVYQEARLELLRDIYSKNESVKKNIDSGIEKAQKIIDRIVFACFAEDRGLLPDDTIHRVVLASDNSAFGGSLWATFKAFFEALDLGSEKLGIPNGYNGGLFAHNPEMDALKVGDEALRSVAELGKYNFDEDLSVTILGHIFEQSISDLEEIKNKVNKAQDLKELQQSRRKKDGIFYTPDYIVRYIVDNSLGAYLRECEEKIKKEFRLKGDIKHQTYEKRERQAYYKYQEVLQNVKIVDPACGSGAFLVYVFDYLLAENKRIASILGNNLFSAENYIKSILQNNIYGVDLNEESVEITKLSLWLKTAQKDKKLTALDNNIKCGNSLIDDSEVAGNKAFNWHEEFPYVFENGGFDVVVGNPPYVQFQKLDKSTRVYLKKNRYYESQSDLWYFFVYKAEEIMQNNGFLSFIVSNYFLTSVRAESLRSFISDKFEIKSLMNFTGENIFEDAGIHTLIFCLRKRCESFPYSARYFEPEVKSLTSYRVDIAIDSNHFGSKWILVSDDTYTILKKISSGSKISEYFNLSNGVKSGADKFFVTDAATAKSKQIEKVALRPYIKSTDISPYFIGWSGKYIIFISSGLDIDTIPKAMKYISGHKDELEAKWKQRGENENWYKLYRPREEIFLRHFEAIVCPYRAKKNSFAVTSDYLGGTDVYYLIRNEHDLKNYPVELIVALLNSKLGNWVYGHTGKKKAELFEYTSQPIKDFPLPIGDDEDIKIAVAEKSGMMAGINEDMHKMNDHYKILLTNELELQGWPKSLKEWWTLDFNGFVKEFKSKLNVHQKDDLLTLFEKYQPQLINFQIRLNQTSSEIDQMVYQLYNLTQEEIQMIEGGC